MFSYASINNYIQISLDITYRCYIIHYMTKYSCAKHSTHGATGKRDMRTNESKFGISLLANVGSPLPRVMPSAAQAIAIQL